MNPTLAKTLIPALFAGTALIAAPSAGAAVPLAGQALEAYGTIDLSLDLSDNDIPGESSNFSLSSNASLLGLRGQHDIDSNLSLVWQLAQEYRADSGGGAFATHDTFAGFRSRDYGTLLFGYHDTPFKTLESRWSVLGGTVAESRSLLGASSDGAVNMNQRAQNALLYINTFRGLEVQGMYATDAQDIDAEDVDDNDNDLFSIAAWYTLGALELSAGYESWSELAGSDAKGLRLAASHPVTRDGKLGLIFERISSDDVPGLERNVFGINGALRAGNNTFEAQVLIADDSDAAGDGSAIKVGLGARRQLDAQTEIYAALSLTRNDDGAQYKAAAGDHGDEIDTVPGGDPSALSIGFRFSF
ncbi:MAG: porin [Gammaproteobacteria bacterium]|nr:porin [Gammaproteobacteria bacterium]